MEIPKTNISNRIRNKLCGTSIKTEGFTTQAQADQLAKYLHLTSGVRLLELGSGYGWPGLYLARRSGCDTVLLDIPIEALREAAESINRQEIYHHCSVVVANGTTLPFRTQSFDAVTHSDVLC